MDVMGDHWCQKAGSGTGLREEGLVDLHSGVGALAQGVAAPPPGVVDRWVGAGDAAEEHCPFKVELLLGLADALVHCDHRIIQVWVGGWVGCISSRKNYSRCSQN